MRCSRKVMGVATLCMNRQRCCLHLHIAVRFTPFAGSVPVCTINNCYANIESIWSWVCEVRSKMDLQKLDKPSKTNCQSNFLLGSPWKAQKEGGACVTRHCTHLDAAPRQLPVPYGNFHHWIFDEKKIHWFPSNPILWFLGPVNYFNSPSSKSTWKGAILVLWIISRRT